jgi:aminoglycoside phosphotransferase (APT) family kinase protein
MIREADAAPVRPGEELDPKRVGPWLRERIEGLAGPLEVLQFHGGHANLTYLLRFGNRELVLRRPPLGPVAPGAHDMAREYRVLSRLHAHFPRAPRAFALCEDPALIGAPFFVMERRHGVVIRGPLPPELARQPDAARRASLALVDAMADLHALDWQAAGLADLGRPEGFAGRQLAGWRKRFELARDVTLPLFDEVHAALARGLPDASGASLIHNDLKLDNCQFDPADPDRVAAIFDWDMATLGDPLFDLGTLLGYWHEPGDPADRVVGPVLALPPGVPPRRELAGRYATRRGVPLPALAWYEAFALWKTAVILQQIHARYARGQTRDERFAGLDAAVPALVRSAAQVLERG